MNKQITRRWTIGETLYGEHNEETQTLHAARGYLIVDMTTGAHVAIVPGADEEYTSTTPAARITRLIVGAPEMRVALGDLLASIEAWQEQYDPDKTDAVTETARARARTLLAAIDED